MSMPNRLLGRSHTRSLLATTSKSGPRYLLIVLALAGDSTMTRLFFFFAAATANPPCTASRVISNGVRRWTSSLLLGVKVCPGGRQKKMAGPGGPATLDG